MYNNLIKNPGYGDIVREHLPESLFVAFVTKLANDSQTNPALFTPIIDMLADNYFSELANEIPYTSIHGMYLPPLLTELGWNNWSILEIDTFAHFTKRISLAIVRDAISKYLAFNYWYIGTPTEITSMHKYTKVPLDIKMTSGSSSLNIVSVKDSDQWIPAIMDHDAKTAFFPTHNVSKEEIQKLF